MIPPLLKSAAGRKDVHAVSVHFRPEAILHAEHEAFGLALAHVIGALLTALLAGAVAWAHWQLLLPVLLPLFALLAVIVKFDSPGPVLFWQDRMGFRGKPFRMCKFRTMGLDSELAGSKFATVGDARVTRIGKFLRESRLGELPQLWNVLCGDMSIIGPRPRWWPTPRRRKSSGMITRI